MKCSFESIFLVKIAIMSKKKLSSRRIQRFMSSGDYVTRYSCEGEMYTCYAHHSIHETDQYYDTYHCEECDQDFYISAHPGHILVENNKRYLSGYTAVVVDGSVERFIYNALEIVPNVEIRMPS